MKSTTLGLDEKVLESVIPMKGRMIHVNENKLKSQPYGVFGEVGFSFIVYLLGGKGDASRIASKYGCYVCEC